MDDKDLHTQNQDNQNEHTTNHKSIDIVNPKSRTHFGTNSFLEKKYSIDTDKKISKPILPIKELQPIVKEDAPDFNKSTTENEEKFSSKLFENQETKSQIEGTNLETSKEDKDEESTSLSKVAEITTTRPLTTDLKNELEKPSFFKSVKAFFKRHKKAIGLATIILLILGIIGGTISGFWLINRYNNLEDVVAQAVALREGSVVYDRNNQELFRFYDGGENRQVVTGDKIPELMKGAIIALEDENYYENTVGIPWANLLGATTKCAISVGQDCRGGSGISQQLIKNVTGDKESSLRRKIDELLIAIKFNQQVSGNTEQEKQDEVLRLYLNWVPFGRNSYGVQAASKSFFGKDIYSPDLTVPEACYLASMVQRPSTYTEAIRIEMLNRQNKDNQVANPYWETLEGRKNACIDKLASKNLKDHGKSKFLTQEEADNYKKVVVEFKAQIGQSLAYGHLRNYLTEELSKLGIDETQLATQGYKIYTTFDKTVQDKVQEIVSSSASTIIIPNGGNNSAAMVLDGPSGGILAMIGSVDFNNDAIGGQVNVATSARQPGSSYKIYDYASAFEKGFNPGTVLVDLTTNFGGYTPANFSRTTQGLTTIRSALQNSLNIPAVKAAYLSQSGGNQPNTNSALSTVINFAKKVGVDHPYEDNCTLSTVIGGCEVSMVSHITGYNTILQDGNLKTANPFIKILTQDGLEVGGLDKQYPKKDGVVDAAVAHQVTDVLSDYNSRSPAVWGNGRFSLQLDGWTGANSVAAKSGTTNDVKDTWTLGGSPLYTVAVWVGNTDGKPMKANATSSGTASTIWKNIMTYVHTDKTKVGFSKAGLQKVNLDPLTGLLGEGSSEYLTPSQINALKKADSNYNDPNYNPSENSILTNRSVFAKRNLTVTKFDGSVVPNGVTIDEALTEKIVCQELISEFPKAANWFDVVNSFAKNLGDKIKICPTKIYDGKLDSAGPTITTNLITQKGVPDEIKISAKSLIATAKIKQIQMVVSSKIVVDETDQDSILVDTKSLKLKGVSDVKIIVTDDSGLKTEITIADIDFDNIISSSSSSSSSSKSSKSSSSTSTSLSSSAASSI